MTGETPAAKPLAETVADARQTLEAVAEETAAETVDRIKEAVASALIGLVTPAEPPGVGPVPSSSAVRG